MSYKFQTAYEQLLAAVELNLSDMQSAFKARNRFAFQGHTLEAYNKLARSVNSVKRIASEAQ